MVSDRLININKKLKLLYEQLDSLQNDVLTKLERCEKIGFYFE
jgi:hypothetical protein